MILVGHFDFGGRFFDLIDPLFHGLESQGFEGYHHGTDVLVEVLGESHLVQGEKRGLLDLAAAGAAGGSAHRKTAHPLDDLVRADDAEEEDRSGLVLHGEALLSGLESQNSDLLVTVTDTVDHLAAAEAQALHGLIVDGKAGDVIDEVAGDLLDRRPAVLDLLPIGAGNIGDHGGFDHLVLVDSYLAILFDHFAEFGHTMLLKLQPQAWDFCCRLTNVNPFIDVIISSWRFRTLRLGFVYLGYSGQPSQDRGGT